MSTLGTRDMSNAVRKRQAIEKAIAVAAIDQLLAAGFSLGVNDGEETTIHHSKDKSAIVKALFTTDEDYLYVYEANDIDMSDLRPAYWVRFVYGNDGYDVISDYSVSLDPHLTEAIALAEKSKARYTAK